MPRQARAAIRSGALPALTVSLVLTDIERSAGLLQELGSELYAQPLHAHRHQVREAVAAQRGLKVGTVCDAFIVVGGSTAAGGPEEASGSWASGSWASPPVGVVTFCLTDVVSSTQLWDTAPETMADTLADHDELVKGVIEAHGGQLVKSKGEGDSTFSVFQSASAAVAAAAEVVTRLGARAWPPGGLAVRAGVHTGEVDQCRGDWFGPVVNRAARIRGLTEGAGVLCSNTTAALVGEHLANGLVLVDLGERSLRGLQVPERVWAVLGPHLAAPALTMAPQHPAIARPDTSLVGRDEDLSAVGALVRRHRLVSLVGAAGSGKTRLAREVASRIPFPAGARLVELTQVREPAAVAPAVFASLTVDGGGDLSGDTPSGVADSPMLLVVDNCEHVVDAAADAIRALLDVTRQVRVLATTREALGLSDEVVHPVKPLLLPLKGDLSLAALSTVPAVRLFLDRAHAARPGLRVTEADP